jgi:hypothetical protein
MPRESIGCFQPPAAQLHFMKRVLYVNRVHHAIIPFEGIQKAANVILNGVKNPIQMSRFFGLIKNIGPQNDF